MMPSLIPAALAIDFMVVPVGSPLCEKTLRAAARMVPRRSSEGRRRCFGLTFPLVPLFAIPGFPISSACEEITHSVSRFVDSGDSGVDKSPLRRPFSAGQGANGAGALLKCLRTFDPRRNDSAISGDSGALFTVLTPDVKPVGRT